MSSETTTRIDELERELARRAFAFRSSPEGSTERDEAVAGYHRVLKSLMELESWCGTPDLDSQLPDEFMPHFYKDYWNESEQSGGGGNIESCGHAEARVSRMSMAKPRCDKALIDATLECIQSLLNTSTDAEMVIHYRRENKNAISVTFSGATSHKCDVSIAQAETIQVLDVYRRECSSLQFNALVFFILSAILSNSRSTGSGQGRIEIRTKRHGAGRAAVRASNTVEEAFEFEPQPTEADSSLGG